MAAAPIVVHDLGSGTGSMMRWLAPLLPGPQTWVLHDWNPALLDHAAARASDSSGHPAAVRTSVRDVGQLRDGDLEGASLITASALLDVLTLDETEAIVRACVAAGAPALIALTVTGRVEIEPVDPGDRVFESAFNDHQRRATAGRRLLGPDAVATVVDLFEAAGWSVRVSDTPWRLDVTDSELVREWLQGWVDAAVEERPALEEWGREYVRERLSQLRDQRLRVVVHHQDVLAWPP
jgi:trans-aconitate methyltransferase